MSNDFINNALNCGVRTENGAVSYGTTGSELIDQFAHAGTARGRDIEDVWVEQSRLWGENPLYALRFPFYLRMITRQTNLFDDKTEKVQKGQGAKDESFKRLLWLAEFHPDEFYRNLWVLPLVGCWKDLWILLTMSDNLDKKAFFNLIASGINSDYHRDLVKKYLPRIRANKVCTTEWAKKTNKLAKEFAAYAGWSMKDYREFKSTGKAHAFQTIICSRDYENINWNLIPGKALLNLVSGKFLEKHGLVNSYLTWLNKQPVAKFNGYVYELGMKWSDRMKQSLAQKVTIDKQFNNLIETAIKDGPAFEGNVLCALDTSGSMTCPINGANGLTSFDVCVSLGIYFAELNKGSFHNTVAMFDSTSTLKKLHGDSFTDRWDDIRNSKTAWGSTNYMSLIKLICSTRVNHPEIPLEDFPTTLLVVSDMQFNPTYISNRERELTNYEGMMALLREVFPSEWVDNFKVIWWYCAGRKDASQDVPATMDKAGQYLFSGFDGSIVSAILNTKIDEKTGEKRTPTMEEVVQDALNQEVLLMVQ